VRERKQRQDTAALDFPEQRQGEIAGDTEYFGCTTARKSLQKSLG
jgi:hypothetical protein